MNQGKLHRKLGNTGLNDLRKLEEQLEIPFAKTKADVWTEMEMQIDTTPQHVKIRLLSRPVFRMAVAASVLIVFGIAGLMRFYTISITTLPGQHQLVSLPDGSTIQMNAMSSISYHPYWWRFSRHVQLAGEAFFEVEKGSRFMVSSDQASTTVLGTSFNVYSREKTYRVSCLTGKVQVRSGDSEAILTANEKAGLKEDGTFEVQKNIIFENEAAWINNEFNFRNKPLQEILEEVERQYDVIIHDKNILNNEMADAKMSGRLIRTELSSNQILEMIAAIYHLKFEQLKENEYRLSKKD